MFCRHRGLKKLEQIIKMGTVYPCGLNKVCSILNFVIEYKRCLKKVGEYNSLDMTITTKMRTTVQTYQFYNNDNFTNL